MKIIYYHFIRIFGIGEDCDPLSSAKELATAAKAVLAQTTVSSIVFYGSCLGVLGGGRINWSLDRCSNRQDARSFATVNFVNVNKPFVFWDEIRTLTDGR
jgi:hypothetical protein